MAGMTPEAIDRLHASLLTSGIQQQNNALFFVVDQLINAVRQALTGVQIITGGGGGGGGILGQTFATVNNDQASLPNSRQLWPGQGINFNNQGQKLVIDAVLPFIMDGQDGEDGMWGPPGIQGPIGPAGPSGSGSMSGYAIPEGYFECCGEVVPLLPIDIAHLSLNETVTGAWIFNTRFGANTALDVRHNSGQASINVVTGSALTPALIFLQSQNGQGLSIAKLNNAVQVTLGNDSGIFQIITGGAGALLGADGLQFPATQVASSNANCLDDYEEGSWTPVISGDGGTSGQTYGTQVGRYIKVGRLVVCPYEVSLTVEGVITGNVQISGLPFTAEAATTRPIHAIEWGNTATNWVFVVGLTLETTTFCYVRGAQAAAGNADLNLLAADIGNNTFFRGCVVYRSDA